jgi:hypothetical protein
VQTQTDKLAKSCRMTREAFWGRIANNSETSVVHHPGYVDVFKAGQHVARWLPYSKVLWYAPNGKASQRTLEGQATTWPPPCPDCGGSVIVKWGGEPREPFWSCRKWDAPWPRACEGRKPFTLHPEEMAEYTAYDPRYWRELVERSLARLIGQGIDNSSTIVLGTNVPRTGAPVGDG